MVISFRGRLTNEDSQVRKAQRELNCKCSAISQNKVCMCIKEYTVYNDEIVMKVTPEMVRLLMKTTRKDSKYATTSNAQSFMKLFKEEIEDGLREAVKDVIRRHYD